MPFVDLFLALNFNHIGVNMPAEAIGFLREDSTYGEKKALELLKQNLPKDFTVYVESPIHKTRDIRYPDFIVLTNYGIIVLEVKDWVTVTHADPNGATIREHSGGTHWEPNPVTKARKFAIDLSNELKKKLPKDGSSEPIPWSYAALLINLPYSVITQLRVPWGEDFVLGEDDLIVPDLLRNRLKMTFPSDRMRPLTKAELDLARATIYPIVEIELPDRPIFVLDEQQEKIVAEPVRVESPVSSKLRKKEDARRQEEIFENLKTSEEEEALPADGEKIVRNASIRLVRGFAGSGKSLVLIQRAKFLAAQYPDWQIGVFTYNKQLQKELENAFVDTTIKSQTFHSLCLSLLPQQGEPANIDTWLEGNKFDFEIIRKLGVPAVKIEVEWIRDIGFMDRQLYLNVERHGIGKELRLSAEQRNRMFDVHEEYLSHLAQNKLWNWNTLPFMLEREIAAGRVTQKMFDAILIDEAQDWAPNWIKIINRMVNPEHGVIFLADDPSQSIYRSFSWKEKGIKVAGRTRWLKIPYRNTQEIYRAAYAMIADNTDIQESLAEKGELVKPDLVSTSMRHGSRPLIQKCASLEKELEFIKNTILYLRQDGYKDHQIAVLVRYTNSLKDVQNAMRGYDIRIHPIHGFKGLEVDAVFIPHLQRTFQKEEEEYITAERRIMYMAMTRARKHLYMTYFGKLPRPYEDLRRNSFADFVG